MTGRRGRVRSTPPRSRPPPPSPGATGSVLRRAAPRGRRRRRTPPTTTRPADAAPERAGARSPARVGWLVTQPPAHTHCVAATPAPISRAARRPVALDLPVRRANNPSAALRAATAARSPATSASSSAGGSHPRTASARWSTASSSSSNMCAIVLRPTDTGGSSRVINRGLWDSRHLWTALCWSSAARVLHVRVAQQNRARDRHLKRPRPAGTTRRVDFRRERPSRADPRARGEVRIRCGPWCAQSALVARNQFSKRLRTSTDAYPSPAPTDHRRARDSRDDVTHQAGQRNDSAS